MIGMRKPIALCVLAASFAMAQDAAPLAFEVASVKVNTTGEKPGGDSKGGRLTLYNIPLRVLVALASSVANDKVAGPGWIDTEGYDIVAKLPPGASDGQLPQMLRSLLAERFMLAFHREEKPMPVWALVVAKNGPKLVKSPEGTTPESKCGREGLQLTCRNKKMTMAALTGNLPRWNSQNWFELPIVDQTALKGEFDVNLTWTLSNHFDSVLDPGALSLFDALVEQLGLKLEQRKAPVERVVIDHAEKVPTEN